LVFNPDGSLTITLSATEPVSGTADWLPVQAGSPSNLTLRDYLPTETVQNGSYLVPNVIAVPEPSFMLGILVVLGALGTDATLKQKLKASKLKDKVELKEVFQ